jgi:ABC-type lipoprotein export system ATPase subunit
VAARAANLSKIYGKGDTQVVALDNVTVAFPAGQYTAVMDTTHAHSGSSALKASIWTPNPRSSKEIGR